VSDVRGAVLRCCTQTAATWCRVGALRRGPRCDNFWDFEEVSDVSRVQEGYVAAGLDASGAYMVEQAGEAFSL
jgi:hypothetical protein